MAFVAGLPTCRAFAAVPMMASTPGLAAARTLLTVFGPVMPHVASLAARRAPATVPVMEVKPAFQVHFILY
jgi:hypothetical protein